MTMRNCQRCGKAYNSTNPTTCPDCVEADLEQFDEVRTFIKDNPKVSFDVVAEATGVSVSQIHDYLRQGRLEAADISGPMIECRRCGKPIFAGQYCVICQTELQNTFRPSTPADTNKKSSDKKDKKRRGSFVRNYRDK